MKYSLAQSFEQRESADLLILPFWEGPIEATEGEHCREAVHSALSSGDFKGKNGESLLVYTEGEKERRLLLLGLGKMENGDPESLRRSYANAARIAQAKKAKRLTLLFPQSRLFPREEILRGVWEGILLSNYVFTHLKEESLKENPPVVLESAQWVGLEQRDQKLLERLATIASGVYFVRELVNGNADEVTPQMLAETAESLQKVSSQLKVEIFDKKRLQHEKMGLILAVSRASSLDPYFIQVSYRGNPRSKEQIALVGKGVTYDTGGLSLKPTEGMISMKADMAGGAMVLGAVQTAAALNLKVNVTALVPAVENGIGSRSYKLGDVYRSYSGKTVEVINTDAEGRLILADALSYAVKNLHPTFLVDCATLTGNIVLALGEEISGFFSNDESLAKALLAASDRTGELLWRMPLYTDYRETLKSDIADLVNLGGKEAGAIKAALFLQEFTGAIPWAHIDCAGTAFWTKPKYYHPTKGTGFGLRLLVEFLEQRAAQ